MHSETVYVCTVCGTQYLPQEIIGMKNDLKSPLRKPIPKKLTKRQEILKGWGDIIDQVEEYNENQDK